MAISIQKDTYRDYDESYFGTCTCCGAEELFHKDQIKAGGLTCFYCENAMSFPELPAEAAPDRRPAWDNYLLGLTLFVRWRSHDIHTQHGCIIADERHRILSTGCNGFPHSLADDRAMPTNRPVPGHPELPHKYNQMRHAEFNALANANGPVRGATAYVSGPPCLDCMQSLWQFDVKRVIHIDGYAYQAYEAQLPHIRLFQEQSGMEIIPVKPDLNWIIDVVLQTPALRQLLQERLADETLRDVFRQVFEQQKAA
jgi:dCMP deaminase